MLSSLPVVPHKAVAEISRINRKPKERLVVASLGCQSKTQTCGPTNELIDSLTDQQRTNELID